jgi:threonine/homoserine/homoserine lactone efflux protein
MSASADLWIFFLLVLGVVVLPGMDMAFVAGSALTSGRRAGFEAVAGIMAAGAVHVAAGTTGIAALLILWPAAFHILLVAGSAYMVWIGWTLLRTCESAASKGAHPVTLPSGAIFLRAAATGLMNPKAYVFVLAVFPAFLHVGDGELATQAIRMGAIVAATQFGVYGVVALAAASAQHGLRSRPQANLWLARIVGATLVIGAVLTPLLSWRTSEGPPPTLLVRGAIVHLTVSEDRAQKLLLRNFGKRIDKQGIGHGTQPGHLPFGELAGGGNRSCSKC